MLKLRKFIVLSLFFLNFSIFSEISFGVKDSFEFINQYALVSDLSIITLYNFENLNISLGLNTSENYFSTTDSILPRIVTTLNSNLCLSYSIFNINNFKFNIGINGSNAVYLTVDNVGQNNLNGLLGANISLEKRIDQFKYFVDFGYNFIILSQSNEKVLSTISDRIKLGVSILYTF